MFFFFEYLNTTRMRVCEENFFRVEIESESVFTDSFWNGNEYSFSKKNEQLMNKIKSERRV